MGNSKGDYPGGPMVKTPGFQHSGSEFNPRGQYWTYSPSYFLRAAGLNGPPSHLSRQGSIRGRGLRFIPDLRSSHVPLSNEVHALQLQSLCSKVHEPQLLKPLGPGARAPNKRNHCNEKAVQQENSPAHYNQRKPACRDEDPVQLKVIWTITLAPSQCTVFSEMDRMA
ncbi:hypothetical protein MJG53_010656 [Ovis ammon polii x Ovis aries]|uniref:Uncharacterized protein n=1 Tax=Ovis ammon polii x Ovis aries TaxID=2918886 RepID=A0ACB9UUD3_9CETA|nr:hypothetical protein MJG53_010656 [Ovis ammon polii x Ovis aries]